MSTLYLDRRATSLRIENRVLVVDIDGKQAATLPLHLIERIILRSNVRLESSVLARLASQGIGIVLFGGQRGQQQAHVLGSEQTDAARRIGQLRQYDDETFRRRWSRRTVLAKVRGERRLLRRALAERADLRAPLTRALEQLDSGLVRIREHSGDRDTLRGLEGAAAASFFRGYRSLFAPELDFTGRNRRPPRDPVNAALSLAYTLMHGDAVQAVHMAGLDPMIGFFHELDYSRASLACDLVEPLRPHVEHWVWEQFRSQNLRAGDFQTRADACLLGKPARARFFAAFEGFARPRRRFLRRWSTRLGRTLAESGRRTRST